MYKVLIIDDEPKVRKGLGRLISELDPEWVVVADARNGKEGLEKVEIHRPDLVITDIRMPKMNGLDLLNVLRDYTAYVVVLSGYGYFEYAQTAIKFGAFDYLLKPTKPEEIQDVLLRVKSRLQESAKSAERPADLQDHSALWKDWLLETVPAEVPPAELCKRFQIDGCPYRLFTVEVDELEELLLEDMWGDRQLVVFAVRNISHDYFAEQENSDCTFLFAHGGQLFYLMKGDGHSLKFFSNLIESVRTWLDISISVGVSDGKERIEQIPAAFTEAREALQNKWIYGPGSCSFFADFHMDETLLGGYPLHLEEALVAAIRECNLDKAFEVYDQFINKLAHPQVTFRVFRRSYLQLSTALIRIIYEYKVYDLVLKDFQPFDLLEHHYSIEKGNARIRKMIESLIEAIEYLKSVKLERTIKKAIDHIHEHYMRDLSLDEIANTVQMSPGYFSTFFKQEVGTTFVDYLTKLRIDKAKQLMNDSRLKLYEVSELVGYSDCKYFSRVFKRVVGVSPAEYREYFYRNEE